MFGSILADKLGIASGPLRLIADLDLNSVGYAIVGMFVVTWVVALVAWKALRIEDTWLAKLRTPGESVEEPV